MAAFELEHPLGQDLEKIHQGLLMGLGTVTERYRDDVLLRFYDAMANKGVSILKMAHWGTKNQVYIELPVVTPDDDHDWLIDWGTGVEPVSFRMRIQDMVGRGFYVQPLDEVSTVPIHTRFLNYAITRNGIALVLKDEEVTNREEGGGIQYAAFESQVYDLFAARVRREASIGELAILADAA